MNGKRRSVVGIKEVSRASQRLRIAVQVEQLTVILRKADYPYSSERRTIDQKRVCLHSLPKAETYSVVDRVAERRRGLITRVHRFVHRNAIHGCLHEDEGKKNNDKSSGCKSPPPR